MEFLEIVVEILRSNNYAKHLIADTSFAPKLMPDRQTAEREAQDDLAKPIPHLLADIFDESQHAVHATRNFDLVQVLVNRRIASLNAVIARGQAEDAQKVQGYLGEIHTLAQRLQHQNDLSEQKIARLNRWMLTLTIIGTLLGGGALLVSVLERYAPRPSLVETQHLPAPAVEASAGTSIAPPPAESQPSDTPNSKTAPASPQSSPN